ncbi:myogenesis-regulating glycosidase [Nilaparvata lugens]|uniref:myogenesis-regulating glycosidase n=1 Tax=Nilaparvata lugens TaxID=108931 RepID=UPI00193D2B98|nr:myogenesis-regulating glycosidase [Nilaparvata lugens]XP_039283380.1 myogenesis-regulating glycosidase [Nilaparvata lugens]
MYRLIKVISYSLVLLTITGPSCFADDDLESDRFEDDELLYRPRVGYHNNHVHLEIPSTLKDKSPKLEANLGRDLEQPSGILFHSQSTEFTWDSQGIQLQISRLPNTNRCHEIKWTSTKKSSLEDCFEIGTASWYGGPEYISQYWPVEKQKFQRMPYVRNGGVGKAEPFWFNSKGISIYVNESTPLFYTVEGRSICLIADNEEPYLPRDELLLQYTLCNFDNPRQAYDYSVDNFFDRPAALPDRRVVEFPVWATKGHYSWSNKKVNQTTVLQFAKDIMIHGFNYSQMEISDNGASCYGTTVFNTSLFPDMKMLTTQLKGMGFRTTMRTHPFVDEECMEYGPLKDKGYFVVNERNEVGMHWWREERWHDWENKKGLIDFTKHSAQQWFVTKHRKVLDDYGIDGFKIDNTFNTVGNGWLSKEARLNCPVEKQPHCYIQSYVETLAELGPIPETRVSFRTQRHAMFVRMLDKNWRDDSIRNVITSVFVHNLHGYPFVIPDVVGGSRWGGYGVTKEIFIRWLQAICFMPVIQFSTAPWDFDEQTVEISKELTALHYRYSGVILELMQRSVDTGAPLNTPIWWVDPENDVAHKIDDEYMLGEDILVAPVLEVGATARDIYLPQGYWREENHRHRVFEGRQWIKNYPAGLKILPYFTRVHEYALSSEQKRKIHRRDKIELITV